MEFYRFIVGALAVWRATHFVVAEPGPWNVMSRVRCGLDRTGFGELLNCFYCFSLWVAAPVGYFLDHDWKWWLLHWLSLSAGAIAIEAGVHRETLGPIYREDQENEYVLRQEQEQEPIRQSK